MTLDQRKPYWLYLVVIFILIAHIRAKQFQDENHDDLEERELTLEKRALGTGNYRQKPKLKPAVRNTSDFIFNGGCKGRPKKPKNSQLHCSKFSGCRATCLTGHHFPNGENKLYIKCMGGKWIDELEVLENIPGCEPFCLPHCQNNGTCVSPNVCKCSKGFFGPQCQFETKPCLNFPQLPKNSRRICGSKSCTILCATGFVFPGGSSVANMVCRDGNWVPTRSDWNSIPDCQPICQPSCQNNSICVSPNVCNCLEGFAGPQCLYQGKPCMNPPPAPVNSRRICRPKHCTSLCDTGFVFPGGSHVATMICHDGNWVPTRSSWRSIPDCQPICQPCCKNSGTCVSPNVCKCSKGFSGLQCQYQKKPCLHFPPLPKNSRHTCDSRSCRILCASGYTFPDGSSVANIVCHDGNWVPSRSDWKSLSDCQPIA